MMVPEESFDPVLPGPGASDYERYLRTDELLSLQKSEAQSAHHDELLFQVTHQASELWLKLAWTEAAVAVQAIEKGDPQAASRLLRRSVLCLRFLTTQLDMLEQMSPSDYQEVRKALGHGSGFDSPGFRELRRIMPELGKAFHERLDESSLTLVELYRNGHLHVALYDLAEVLIELDEWAQMWRVRHYRVISRIIGDSVVGTQGTPVEVLGRLVRKVEYPDLWEVRNTLTALAGNRP